jgi:tryptophan-rich sensory protein
LLRELGWAALAIIALMLAAILRSVAAFWRPDRVTAWPLAPYAARVTFTSILDALVFALTWLLFAFE